MIYFVTAIHIFVCAFLVLVILLQQGRGGGMGAAFGGASQQVFGGAGAGNFLTRLTETAAFTFMFTSIVLAGLATQRGPSKYEEAAQALYLGATSASASASTSATPPAPPATTTTTTATTSPAPTTSAPVESATTAPSTSPSSTGSAQ